MYKVLAVALACLLFTASQSWSETLHTLEPIVVTATKLETPVREVASSVTVITKEEIQSKQQPTVVDVLRGVPALDVVRYGGLGQATSVFLRGANSEHTLVLIDGVPANDPSSPNRLFDFAHLSTDNIERIEIVRGPGSTLYGSDALGGVIQIITKKGKGKPRIQLAAEGGSHETYKEQFSLNGGSEFYNYSLIASYLETDGISSASSSYGNRERDGYESISTSGRLGITPTENFDLDFIFRYYDTENDLDLGGGPSADDPNYVGESKSTFIRSQATLSLFKDFWQQKFGFSFSDYDRTFINKPDSNNPLALDDSSFNGNIYNFDWQNNFYFNDKNTITIGLDYKKEKADNKTFMQGEDPLWGPWTYEEVLKDEDADTIAYYLQDQINFSDVFAATAGLRLDDHSDFASKATYRIAARYLFKSTNTTVKGTFGTGFKAPSLSQLFGSATYTSGGFPMPTIGNPDLKPEEVKSWDIGIEQRFLNDKISLSATYFENDFENLIKNKPIAPGSFIYTYGNVKEAKTKGIEIGATWQPVENFNLSSSYTYTDTEDAKDFSRIPRNKFSVKANYQFMKKGNINIDVVYVGEREDDAYNLETGDFSRVELDNYTLLNLAVSFNATENFRIFARAENILDEDYEEVWGFGTPGISGYIGGEYTF